MFFVNFLNREDLSESSFGNIFFTENEVKDFCCSKFPGKTILREKFNDSFTIDDSLFLIREINDIDLIKTILKKKYPESLWVVTYSILYNDTLIHKKKVFFNLNDINNFFKEIYSINEYIFEYSRFLDESIVEAISGNDTIINIKNIMEIDTFMVFTSLITESIYNPEGKYGK